jgi:sugar-specific transcriptional regulator TrmB
MNKEEVLKQVGLTDAEVKLYITLLSSGEATASLLAKKTATNRTFTYDRLNKLVNVGLASHVIKENKKYFRAADPGQFLSILKERETQFQSILPELESLTAKVEPGPQVTVFSSRKGVQTALNLVLRQSKPLYVHGSLLNFKNSMEHYFDVWNKRRAKTKVKMQALTSEDTKGLELNLAELEELPEEEKNATTTFTFGEKVITVFWSEVPVAILVESKEIAKDNLAFFNTVWNREVKIYSGVDGIVKAFYELISEKNCYYLGVGYSWALAQVYGTGISDKWHKTRIKNKVATRLISYDDRESIDYFKNRSKKWKDFNVKFLNKDICGPACSTISDNIMATFIYTEGSFKVIINRNKETINAYKKHFERLWSMAKKG